MFNEELDVKGKGGFGKSAIRHYLVRNWNTVQPRFLDELSRIGGIGKIKSIDVLGDQLDVHRIIKYFTTSGGRPTFSKPCARTTYSQFIYQMML